MKQIYLFLLFLILSLPIFTQNTMYVQDPQNWWSDDRASVENIDFRVTVFGIYAQVEVEFDLMAANSVLQGTGTPLEFVMNFHMQKDIIFNDSWLWIDNYISRGEIYERFEGTQIYEEIVNRRQDPSILTKLSDVQYSLKVYPLDPDSTRRVKLSYLKALDFEDREPKIEIPYSLFSNSEQTPQNISITIEDNFDWIHYEPEATNYTKVNTVLDRTTYSISNFETLKDTAFRFMSTKGSQPYYLGYYTDGIEKFYQLAYFPDLDIELEPTYSMVALDFDDRHTYNSLTVEALLDQLEENLKAKLNDRDYFNICYHDFLHKFAHDEWIIATDHNIELAIQAIKEDGMDKRSKLDVILPQSLQFIKEQGIDAHLLIISASTDYTYYDDARPFLDAIEDYINTMGVQLKISTLDMATRNTNTGYADNHFYRGHAYFYESLVALYGGVRYTVYEGDHIISSIEKMLESNKFILSEYDFDVDTEGGFAHSNYVNTYNGTSVNSESAILTVGKYVGDFPFNIEFQGLVSGNIFNKSLTVEKADAIPMNDVASTIWYGNYLLNNEKTSDADLKKEVIEISKLARLLCSKTIFLCLEPDTTAISLNSLVEDDNGILISTEDIQIADGDIKAYPNPFVERLTIEIPSTYELGTHPLLLEVFNAEGKSISQSIVSFTTAEGYYTFEWEASEDMVSGLYIFRIRNDKIAFNKKIMYIKR